MAKNSAIQRILPLGVQDFPNIRRLGIVYVDKTARVYELITGSEKMFFLSRPRQFGKSLLCTTLEAIFEGRRELFGEIAGRPALAINNLDWEWKRHPVIRIDLFAGNYGTGTAVLNDVLQHDLDNTARLYGVTLRGKTVPAIFKNLIADLHERFNEKTVVIIDEYDKPLNTTLGKRDVHVELRNTLRTFYGVIGSCDTHLRFVLLTGLSTFSYKSIFSDLKLTDLTFNPRYADLGGLTLVEMETNFGPEIDCILKKTGCSREEYIDKLHRRYNGYRLSKDPLTVYNPLGLIRHIYDAEERSTHWCSGCPTMPSFLAELIKTHKVGTLDPSDMQVRTMDFSTYDIDNIAQAPLLYQTGNLTISDYIAETDTYTLDFPNNEVRTSFTETLVKHNAGAADDGQ